jgi:hypothetical protein
MARSKTFCANANWYGYSGPGLKEKLCQLVGWEAKTDDPRLKTNEAYDVAYEAIYEALPDCRGRCSCG